MPYFDNMASAFSDPPYPLAFAENGDLIGMPQRYGPFSFVVNTDKISREMAEDQGFKLFTTSASSSAPAASSSAWRWPGR